MLKFISFGSGSSGNCYFLYSETDGIMIDVGVGVRSLKKNMKAYGVDLSSIHNILVTHDHADHVKSVGSISRDFDIPVYATNKVHEGIVRNYCVKSKISSERVHVIEKGTSFSLGDFTITPFEVPHDSCDNVGYRIVYHDVTFCIMTDVGHVTDEMKTFISDANYLVIEANHDEEMLANGSYPQHLKNRILSQTGHLCNRDCGNTLVENATPKLHHVWLCHLSEENNHPELARKTIEQILRAHGIVVGKDFQLDVLKRTTPTGIFELK